MMQDKMNRPDDRPQLGISACLLGQEVRYDGGHKHNNYAAVTLAEHCEMVSFCPEVGIGLPTPRPPIRLVKRKGNNENRDAVCSEQKAASIRAVRLDDPSLDYTRQLADYADSNQSQFLGLSGYILKKDSPSCGMERVKVYDEQHEGKKPPERSGRGIFADRLCTLMPWLPVEEEGRLNDPRLRENFVVRVFTLHRWHQLMQAGLTPARLIKFHERHKFLVQAHHEVSYRKLGRLVANAGKAQLEELSQEYLATLMLAMKNMPSKGRVANVILHIMGFIKQQLSGDEKAELLGLIDDYRAGLVPMIVPVTLLNHLLRRFPHPYIGQQYFLEPHPRELMLRNHI